MNMENDAEATVTDIPFVPGISPIEESPTEYTVDPIVRQVEVDGGTHLVVLFYGYSATDDTTEPPITSPNTSSLRTGSKQG